MKSNKWVLERGRGLRIGIFTYVLIERRLKEKKKKKNCKEFTQ
jgi:hypothetical protein